MSGYSGSQSAASQSLGASSSPLVPIASLTPQAASSASSGGVSTANQAAMYEQSSKHQRNGDAIYQQMDKIVSAYEPYIGWGRSATPLSCPPYTRVCAKEAGMTEIPRHC